MIIHKHIGNIFINGPPFSSDYFKQEEFQYEYDRWLESQQRIKERVSQCDHFTRPHMEGFTVTQLEYQIGSNENKGIVYCDKCGNQWEVGFEVDEIPAVIVNLNKK